MRIVGRNLGKTCFKKRSPNENEMEELDESMVALFEGFCGVENAEKCALEYMEYKKSKTTDFSPRTSNLKLCMKTHIYTLIKNNNFASFYLILTLISYFF